MHAHTLLHGLRGGGMQVRRTARDWAGCPRTRKSTTGGMIMVGSHAIKTWSSTQAGGPKLSSGEAEFHAQGKGGAYGLFLKNVLTKLLFPDLLP